jgi:N-acetylglucosaminyl-diphospho-decaprenol L-rhamnosyltransferase
VPADVAISIASHGSPAALIECLRSLPAACAGIEWTTTVVLNIPSNLPAGFNDEFPWARLVRNERPVGFASNHNAVLEPILAADAARYTLVLNDDTVLRAGAVAALVERADSRPRAGAIGPAMVWPDGTPQPSLYSFPTPVRSLVATVIPSVGTCRAIDAGAGWLGGACLLLRATALKQVGLFDTRYFLFFEDVDLCRRLLAGGWTSEVWPAATIVHAAHQTVTRAELSFAMERQMLRSSYLYHRHYHGPLVARSLSSVARAMFLARAGAQLLASIGSPDPGRRQLAGRNVRLAAYEPSRPLPHELVGADS